MFGRGNCVDRLQLCARYRHRTGPGTCLFQPITGRRASDARVGQMAVDLSADVAVDLSADVAELTVDDALLAKLGRDELNIIWRHLSPDDHLAAALTCKAFNSLRPKRRKFPWVAEDLDGKNPMVTEKMKTRLLSTMRSPTLQEWAAALGAPSIYPHWVEIHSLKGAPQYNGRVGRALGPPNESGRLAVEVDAGLGELPRRGSHSTPSLKSILVKAENISTLTCLDSELVYACHAEGGGGIGSSWTSVLLPRQQKPALLCPVGAHGHERNQHVVGARHFV